ncbi:unnamed protein product, partial [Tetraodon nigroviridis]
IDEKLRAARERREEQLKLLGMRASPRRADARYILTYHVSSAHRDKNRQEREQRARRYYEQQLKERKKKLLEQRLKEERRRAAVEEKRRQRLKEEKERFESVVRKTLEKSQRAQQNQNTRGRKPSKNIVPVCRRAASFHSTTDTTILQKPPYPTGSGHKRPSASPSPISIHHRKPSSFSSPINTNRKPPSSSSPVCRQPKIPAASSSPVDSQHRKATVSSSPNRSATPPQIKPAKQRESNKKSLNLGSGTQSPSASRKIQPVPKGRKVSPSPDGSPPKPISSRPTPPLQPELPPVPEEDLPVSSSALSPAGQRGKEVSEEWRSHMPNSPLEGSASPSAPQPPPAPSKPSTGTKDPEEASRLLAERRREARLKREREEQERLQREEEERRRRDELERRRAEEQARQQAEAQHLIEEKRRREEEEQRRAEEERAQAMREAALLQKQREEEQARERARAEQVRQERELLAQKEDAARQARKKRSESVKALPNEAQPKENTQPVRSGTIEDTVRLPVGTKTSQLGLANQEDMVPVVAFKERRSLRTLTGLEEIQTHQRAGEVSDPGSLAQTGSCAHQFGSCVSLQRSSESLRSHGHQLW